MLSEEEIAGQQALLATQRRTLAIYVQQLAEHGQAFAPPMIFSGIYEARQHIRQIKGTLRTAGLEVDDHPNDDPPISSPNAPSAEAAARPILFIPNNLPAGYVKRSGALDALRTALLRSRPAGDMVAEVALHGMGGLGKTVLARAICDDPLVRAAFPDGILWATLGQHAETARHQREWIRALGGDVTSASSLESGAAELRRLLEPRAMLLVLDDIWRAADAQPLQVGGPRCATLITTRDTAQAAGALLVPLELMQREESRALLLTATRGPLPSDMIESIVARLGSLPLALTIVGALLARAIPWPDIADSLDEGDLAFLSYGQSSVLSVIAASVSALPADQAARYNELAIFPQEEPLDENAVALLWGYTAGTKPRQSRRLLADLRDRALVQADHTLHDLHYDYLRAVVSPERAQGWHSALAEAYRDLLDSSDAYGWRRLAYHLARAERRADLRALLEHPRYQQGKIARLGTAALLADFALVSDDDRLEQVAGALRLGAYILDREPGELGNQLRGRLGAAFSPDMFLDPKQVTVVLESRTLTPPGGLLLYTLRGHRDSVYRCALSPDGHMALSASADHTLRVWNIDTGESLHMLQGHTAPVRSCAFSPDGVLALSASWDFTLRLWDVASGQMLRALAGHTERVNDCVFSPDGALALSAGGDHTLRLWEIATGTLIRVFAGHAAALHCCAFSADGSRALSGSHDQTLRLWEVATGATLQVFTGHTARVNACALHPDGRLAISGSDDHTLRLWDVPTGATVRVLQGHVDTVQGCALSADGKVALSASWDSTLALWDIVTGEVVSRLKGHTGSVFGCAFSADGRLILSAAGDETLRLWARATGRPVLDADRGTENVYSCAFSPDGRMALSSLEDATLCLWDVATRLPIRTLAGHAQPAHGCAFSPDGRLALSASSDTTLRLWDVATGATLRTFSGHSHPVHACAFSPDGRQIISASDDTTLRLWDLAAEPVRVFAGHTRSVDDCAFSPDGQLILSASRDHTLRIWELASGATVHILAGHAHRVFGCAFSPDGTLALSASRDRTLRLWNVADGTLVHIFEGHTHGVRDCAFSTDGRYAVSCSWDTTLRIWNIRDGAELAHWAADGALRCCAFSPDGRHIISGDNFGNLHFLRLENL